MMERTGTLDWNLVRAFHATAQAGSLSGAARALGLTQPTLSRQIAQLEGILGILLFERLGRRLSMTAAGRELLAHVGAMGEAANRIALVASGQSQSIEGLVRITAVDIMCAHFLPPVLARLAEVAPGISIDIVASNDIEDLMRREADIAIRHVQPDQPELVGKRCMDVSFNLYAATSYLDRHGRPSGTDDFGRYAIVGYSGVGGDGLLKELNDRGILVNAQNMRWTTGSVLVAWELVKQGVGIGVMFDQIASTTPGVERIVPDMRPLVAPTWLVTHRELHTSRRIRLVFDLLSELLTRH
jgi:DNA-binding transcriptional LysR family regulator